MAAMNSARFTTVISRIGVTIIAKRQLRALLFLRTLEYISTSTANKGKRQARP